MGEYGTKVCLQIIELFIAMIAGYIAKKTHIIDAHSTKSLSSLLAYITSPVLIISSLQVDRDEKVLSMVINILIVSLIVHSVMAVFCYFFFKPVKDRRNRSVFTFALMYMNCGFMGYPIMQAMFPDYGLLYGVIYTVPFNIFLWTHGVAVMDASENRKINFRKIFLNPGIISTVFAVVMFFSGLRFPQVITDGLNMVGSMTFPLSMIIIGSLLADIKLLSLFKEYKLLLFAILKLAVVPLAMLGVCVLAKNVMDFQLALICVTMCATPTATNTAVFAEVYDNNSTLAAKIVGVTTLFSLISMPLILVLAENLLG